MRIKLTEDEAVTLVGRKALDHMIAQRVPCDLMSGARLTALRSRPTSPEIEFTINGTRQQIEQTREVKGVPAEIPEEEPAPGICVD